MGIVVALLAACVLLVKSIRMVDSSPAQLAALELMHTEMPPVQGRDGSDAMWLLGYDIPAADQAKRAAELRAYLTRRFGPGPGPVGATDPRKLWAAFAKDPEAGEGTCHTRSRGCLDYVRQDMARVEATLKTHARTLDATLAFEQFDGIRYGLLPSMQQDIPRVGQARRLVKTHLGWLFASGKQAEAVAKTCSDIASWRRLGSNADILVANAVGVAFVRDSLVLLAEMQAEMPIDQSLPATCAAAFAPVADLERSICASVSTEYRGLSSNLFSDLEAEDAEFAKDPGKAENEDNRLINFLIRHVMDKENTDAMHASSIAQFCTDEGMRNIRSDVPTANWFRTDEICPWLRTVGDPFGCWVADIGMGNNYMKYQDRRLDQVQMLGLMNTLQWLRKSGAPQAEWPTLLKSPPASLGLQRTPEIKDNMLVIPMWDQSYSEDFRLPIRSSDAI